MKSQEISLKKIVYREDLYPRTKPDPKIIQTYAENYENLPPIKISQGNILIDGYHRWKAYETNELDKIPCEIIKVKSEEEIMALALELNATHGLQLSPQEKKKYAIKFCGLWDRKKIIKILSINGSTYDRWTKNKRREAEEERNEKILDLHLKCYTQQEIAGEVNVEQNTVSGVLAKIIKNPQMRDSDIFDKFKAEDFNIWNFTKLTNEVKHFGNIPQEIIENLLYRYTQPFDVVFDPFGGGGSTIDACLKYYRRYYVSDLTPIPARNDIHAWDIANGLPDDLPVPKLTFLDPPYWKQAKGKYSNKRTDLGNVKLDEFYLTIENLIKQLKRKWKVTTEAYLALIIGPTEADGKFYDHARDIGKILDQHFTPIQRVIVPYSTQVCSGANIAQARKSNLMLKLYRDLLIYRVNK